jgi:hypothetical protein
LAASRTPSNNDARRAGRDARAPDEEVFVDPIRGGCLCGAVRYEVRAEPVAVRQCWCRVCQYYAAGNATVNVTFPSATFSLTGELRDHASAADSGSHMHRRFCPRCGVHVVSEAEERPHLVIVRAGTLDDPALAAPTAAIWTKSAPRWAKLDPALACFEGQPPPPAVKAK